VEAELGAMPDQSRSRRLRRLRQAPAALPLQRGLQLPGATPQLGKTQTSKRIERELRALSRHDEIFSCSLADLDWSAC
jgi:hypothetical protein